MKLIELYTAILAAANLVVTEDGYISRRIMDETDPWIVDGKRGVLPTREHLMNPDKENRILFHVLRENIMRGPSEVLESFRTVLNTRLQVSIGLLGVELLSIAASPAEHAKLTPDQSEFLSMVKEADEQTVKNFTKLMGEMPPDQTARCFVSIFIKRAASLEGHTFKRGGIVNFPWFTDLQTAEKELYGVKLRTKDTRSFIKLMEYIFPNLGEKNSYSRGSDSDVAPTTDALMKALAAVASRINDILDLFGDKIGTADIIRIPADWAEAFDDLESFLPEIRSIPMQLGNEGKALLVEKALEEQRAQAGQADMPAELQQAKNLAQTGIESVQRLPQPAQPAGPVIGAGVNPSIVPQQPTAPAPTRTGGGLDFGSLGVSRAMGMVPTTGMLMVQSVPMMPGRTGQLMMQQGMTAPAHNQSHLQFTGFGVGTPLGFRV